MFKYQLPIIQDIRAVKSAREIKHITRAQKISELVLIKVVSRLKVGITEVALARFIVHNFKQRGITALAFEPIVAFGKNTADIHHWATATKLKVGDTVKISGHDKEHTQKVTSLQVEHKKVLEVLPGESCGMQVDKPVKPGDVLYLGSA